MDKLDYKKEYKDLYLPNQTNAYRRTKYEVYNGKGKRKSK